MQHIIPQLPWPRLIAELHHSLEYLLSENRIAFESSHDIGRPFSLGDLRHWLTQHKSGTRLPPERALAETLRLSRPALRKALAVLEAEGRILRHVGRGTFVATPTAPSYPGLSALTARTGPHDAMMARLALEPELARLAALHATPLQIDALQVLAAEGRAAATWEDYERHDHDLHDRIAESAGNVLLHELHKIMNAVRQVVVWRQLPMEVDGPPADYHSFDEHDTIVAAIATRDRSAAKAAMRAHLNATLHAMTAED